MPTTEVEFPVIDVTEPEYADVPNHPEPTSTLEDPESTILSRKSISNSLAQAARSLLQVTLLRLRNRRVTSCRTHRKVVRPVPKRSRSIAS